jgi:CubicO group peptidase (beta-lactamase class C family)
MLSCLGKLVRASNTHSATNRETYRGCLCRWSFLLSLISVYANAQINNPPELGQRLQSLIDSRFEGYEVPGTVSCRRLAQQNYSFESMGQSRAASGRGEAADLEQNVPMTTASVHRLASLSKPITGTIIMDLVENGKLALDASIRQYLARLPEDYQKVTVRHLLSHQSGIGFAADDLSVVFSTKHYATAEDALKLVSPSPVFEPGSKVEYSSAAFTVLGAAAEAVTGKSFQQLSKDFFARHGINGFLLDDPYAIVPNRVRGYLVGRNSEIKLNNGRTISREYLKGTSGEITNAVLYDISNRYPAAGFDASAEDLLRFVIAVGTGQVLLAETNFARDR